MSRSWKKLLLRRMRSLQGSGRLGCVARRRLGVVSMRRAAHLAPTEMRSTPRVCPFHSRPPCWALCCDTRASDRSRTISPFTVKRVSDLFIALLPQQALSGSLAKEDVNSVRAPFFKLRDNTLDKEPFFFFFVSLDLLHWTNTDVTRRIVFPHLLFSGRLGGSGGIFGGEFVVPGSLETPCRIVALFLDNSALNKKENVALIEFSHSYRVCMH